MNPHRPRMPKGSALRAMGITWQRTLLLAGAIGVITGLGVTLFEWFTARVLLANVLKLPHWAEACVPALGLLAAWLLLKYVAKASPSTSDEYIKNYHERGVPLDLRPVLGRILASVATLGTGGALGFEGPSIYMGAATGSYAARRSPWSDPTKILMVAGAAAGVSAIFKTPATGVLFALEVPFREDIAADAVLPTVIASAASYLVFVAFNGTAALFPVAGNPSFSARDLLGAAALGVLAGLGAHLFARAVLGAKAASSRIPGPVRWLVGGVGLAALAATTFALYGSPLALGSGYSVIAWLSDPSRSLGLIALLFLIRFMATSFTLTGGGAGGLFIPLVVLGALLGRFFGGAMGVPTTLFPVIGAAAFLGAGYRTPLAAVMFVAESTGRPGFIVPGLIATAIAQLMMGRTSVSPYLLRVRPGDVGRRLALSVDQVMDPAPTVASPEDSVTALIRDRFPQASLGTLPVVRDGNYLGSVRLIDLAAAAGSGDSELRAGDLMSETVPVAEPGWTLGEAARAIEVAATDGIAVVQGGRFLGFVAMSAISGLSDGVAPEDEAN